MPTDSSRSQGGSRQQRERDSFSDKEAAKRLGISKIKLYRICNFFDSASEGKWKFIEGESFEYEPGQARKRRFYEEGMMAIAKYLEETEGGSFLAQLKGFFAHHQDRRTRFEVEHRIVQATQDSSALVIRDGALFLLQRWVALVLGTNGKGIASTRRLIEEKSANLEGAEGLEVGVHFFADSSGRYWSLRGMILLARTMCEKRRLPRIRKVWLKAFNDVGEDCLQEVQRQRRLESHEARVRSAKERARRKAKACAVTQQKPNAAADSPIELDVHHLFDAATRPNLATLDDNLLVITSAVHRNFHHWMGNRPCEPRDFVKYLLHNELAYFEGRTLRTHACQQRRLKELIYRLEMLQNRYEGNRPS